MIRISRYIQKSGGMAVLFKYGNLALRNWLWQFVLKTKLSVTPTTIPKNLYPKGDNVPSLLLNPQRGIRDKYLRGIYWTERRTARYKIERVIVSVGM